MPESRNVFLRFKGDDDFDVDKMMAGVDQRARPTVGDLLFAGQRQRSRILQRTQRGVDFNETSFSPYSTKGPYYFYPGKSSKNRKAAAGRLARKLGIPARGPGRKKASTVRTALGIRFPSYAAFKASLGRSNVDLRGPSAPHMLQAIVVRVKGFILGFQDVTENQSNTEEADTMRVGIYGPEAERAEGHQTGAGHLPRRKFLGASESDKSLILADILSRATARVKAFIGGA